ncbi:MAG: DNA mismatch repair endonuclease MutL [Candidatus Eisenbacteria sp.]|nr:DNA mismatch repair endonuclease MutL [Candidatus Eisenbacteria bacterium]
MGEKTTSSDRRSIQRLPAEVIGRIAAGEMIARPAAAVKELIENALDAGAGRITISVTEALDRSIEVADDGTGIAGDDLALALERYTTSKIGREEDLLAIETLGFRGEALAAIAEIARVTVTSRTADAEHAWRIQATGGQVGSPEVASRGVGTTVTVADLFFNTPVRKRFLKSAASELRAAREVIQAYAQAFPGVAWRFTQDGRTVLELAPVEAMQARLSQLHGARLLEGLLAVEGRDEAGFGVRGFVGVPELARAGSRHQTFFVNGRWVVSPWLGQAVRRAFGDLIPNHQAPWALLLLTVPADRVDVNLHPTKREVRFFEERAIFAFVQRMVRVVVARLLPRFFLSAESGGQEAGTGAGASGGAEGGWRRGGAGATGIFPGPERAPGGYEAVTKELYGGPGGAGAVAGTEDAQLGDLWGPAGPRNRVAEGAGGAGAELGGRPDEGLVSLWQLHGRYVLAQTHKGLLIIDQHAAHERILYERIQERMQSEEAAAQQLLFPVILELTDEEIEVYREHEAEMLRMGFECEELEERSVIVRGVPPLWRSRSEAGLVLDLLHETESMGLREGETREGLARAFACRAAIKAGEPLSVEEMNRLVDELFATRLPHGDPHGRPTFVFISLGDLDRRFGRGGGG